MKWNVHSSRPRDAVVVMQTPHCHSTYWMTLTTFLRPRSLQEFARYQLVTLTWVQHSGHFCPTTISAYEVREGDRDRRLAHTMSLWPNSNTMDMRRVSVVSGTCRFQNSNLLFRTIYRTQVLFLELINNMNKMVTSAKGELVNPIRIVNPFG